MLPLLSKKKNKKCINLTKIVQTLLQASVLDRITKHNSRLIVDTKGVLPIFFRLKGPRILSNLGSNRSWWNNRVEI